MKNPPFDSLVWGSLRLAPNTVLVTVAFLIGYQCLQEWENHRHSTVEDSQNGLCTKKFTKTKNSVTTLMGRVHSLLQVELSSLIIKCFAIPRHHALL